MGWKLPLNQIGGGGTFVVGPKNVPSRFRETALNIDQHPWLQDILTELRCNVAGSESNFSLSVDVEKQSDTYRVKAHLHMVPELECVRSLTLFRTAIESENEALFIKGSGVPMVGEHELSESELESYEHDGQVLTLSDFITDVVFTSLPDFPLCRPHCKGLCADCGCHLNDAITCEKTDHRANRDFVCAHFPAPSSAE